jgi:transcription elongation GreA/GreB family factor
MSRAFVKESDGDEGEALPELRVSEHRNLVTPAGLGQIEANVERLQAVLSAARAAEDRAAVARVQRDLRYWSARLRSAEVVPLPGAAEVVRFGSAVVLQDPSGRHIDYQVVGEDEADPAHGRISYVSPIARRLIGASVGDTVALAEGEAEILEVR